MLIPTGIVLELMRDERDAIADILYQPGYLAENPPRYSAICL
ncbi:MAG: hypothetical protein AB4368_01345 [Xenococcaceae cyanobacterium]